MKSTFHFDIGTLFVAESLICFIFALVLFILARQFRQMRGPTQFSQAFFAGGLGTLVYLGRGVMPLTLNVLLGNGLLMLAAMLLYAGAAKLLHIRARLRVPIASSIVTLCMLAYFTAVNDRISVRIVFLSINSCIIQYYLFVDLLRYPRRSIIVRFLALSVMLSMFSDFLWGLANAVNGTPADFFQYRLTTVVYIATGIFSACGMGIFSMALVAREITASVERSARRDPLTGSLNRRGIEELLGVEIERSRRTLVPLSVALLDIDHFKAFNDSGGHAAGDDVLRKVAAAISHQLRPYDACGRIGGDEFLALLPGSDASTAAIVCDRILHEIAALPPHPNSDISPTVSVGFTESDLADTVTAILARADRALYAAKHQGRNCARLELAPVRTLPSEIPAASKPLRKSRLRRAASSVRRFRS